MSLLELLLIATGLAMDAFAVSICGSMVLEPEHRLKGALRFGAWFGFFQGIMPLIGFFCGISFRSHIEEYDHWVAFVLLCYLGINMLIQSRSADCCDIRQKYSFRDMLTLSVATSIDALAIGISFAFLNVDIVEAAIIIGLVTFALATMGAIAGCKLGERIGSRATAIGGAVLIIIGTKILLEHTGYL